MDHRLQENHAEVQQMNKRTLGLIAVAVAIGVILAAVAAVAQGPAASCGGCRAAAPAKAAAPKADAGPAVDKSGPGGCGGQCGGAGKCGGHARSMGMGMMQGPVEVTVESQRIWKSIEKLMVKQHRAMWDMFRLQSRGDVDQKQIDAKIAELQKLSADLAGQNEALAEFRSVDAGAGCPMAAAGKCGGKRPMDGTGCGPKQGRGHGAGRGCSGNCG